ncbi:ArsR family transcriptional regulator [Roseburia faecis]
MSYCSHLTVLPATIIAHLKCLYEAGAVITQ